MLPSPLRASLRRRPVLAGLAALCVIPFGWARAQQGANGPVEAPVGEVSRLIGAAAALSQDGTDARALAVGDPVFGQETLSVDPDDANARLEVRLSDGTLLQLGSGTQALVRDYLFDPGTGTGSLGLLFNTGAFRVVSGSIAKTPGPDGGPSMQVETPVASLGVRGTEFIGGLVAEAQSWELLLLSGQVDVVNDQGSVTLNEAGQGTSVTVDDALLAAVAEALAEETPPAQSLTADTGSDDGSALVARPADDAGDRDVSEIDRPPAVIPQGTPPPRPLRRLPPGLRRPSRTRRAVPPGFRRPPPLRAGLHRQLRRPPPPPAAVQVWAVARRNRLAARIAFH